MKIILVNDDGIYAEGIKTMASHLIKAGHELIVIAPDQERSAISHAITIRSPLRLSQVGNYVNQNTAYKVNGTPADCIKLALRYFSEFTPDLIISGINNGHNLGYDVFYSGTVSAAIEAYINGYKSIAVSLSIKKDRNFKTAAKKVVELLTDSKFLSLLKNSSGPLNINFPDVKLEEIKGLKLTSLANKIYDRSIEERVDPLGRKYYWFVGDNNVEYDLNYDIGAVKDGYISITPLNIELTDEELIEADN